MIVYVVTTHTDLGRKVKAVFEDRDQAIYCCALCEREYPEIEEMDTEAIQITGNKKPLAEWTVCFDADGNVIDCDRRYTFSETLRLVEDIGGCETMFLTVDKDLTEDEVKEIAQNHRRRMKG